MLIFNSIAKNKLILILARNSFLICLVVTFLDMFQYVMQNSKNNVNLAFMPPITTRERNNLFRLLHIFLEEVEAANLTYFMYGGTLLGSYRHHGMIPWDDDLDFMFDGHQKEQVLHVLQNMHPGIGVWPSKPSSFLKVYYTDGQKFLHRSYSWPFIDVFFFETNNSHIWDSKWSHDYIFSRSLVFPLHRRPFEDYLLPAPYNTSGFLSYMYKIDTCLTRSRNHVYGFGLPALAVNSVPCHLLYDSFPFVSRTTAEDGSTQEVLMKGSIAVSKNPIINTTDTEK